MHAHLRVALIDDHQLFRQGLRALLSGYPDLTLIGEADDARSGYVLVEQHRPDVVLLDVNLPGVSGISATREIRRRMPEGKVLVLSGYADASYAAQALAAGASGYVLKSQSMDALAEAIRAVGGGERYVPPELAHRLRDQPQADKGEDALAHLSMREREVFELLIRGFSNQQVAKELCISVKTVETHRARIHRKLSVHSVAELMRFGALHGLIRE